MAKIMLICIVLGLVGLLWMPHSVEAKPYFFKFFDVSQNVNTVRTTPRTPVVSTFVLTDFLARKLEFLAGILSNQGSVSYNVGFNKVGQATAQQPTTTSRPISTTPVQTVFVPESTESLVPASLATTAIPVIGQRVSSVQTEVVVGVNKIISSTALQPAIAAATTAGTTLAPASGPISGPAFVSITASTTAGTLAALPGTAAASAGTPAASVGTSAALAGTPVAPAGAPVAPAGAPVAPVGAPVAPAGAPVAPAGAPVAPVGAPVAPAGAPVAPAVAPVAPAGAPVAPAGAPAAAPVASAGAPVASAGAAAAAAGTPAGNPGIPAASAQPSASSPAPFARPVPSLPPTPASSTDNIIILSLFDQTVGSSTSAPGNPSATVGPLLPVNVPTQATLTSGFSVAEAATKRNGYGYSDPNVLLFDASNEIFNDVQKSLRSHDTQTLDLDIRT